MNGQMLWFNSEKGFGFICTEDEERLYVAQSAFQPGEVPEGRCARRPVVFDVDDRDGEAEAVNVRFCSEDSPRRARRRPGGIRRGS
jgi:cold shock CspA family protein